jgi:hypothetical protein
MIDTFVDYLGHSTAITIFVFILLSVYFIVTIWIFVYKSLELNSSIKKELNSLNSLYASDLKINPSSTIGMIIADNPYVAKKLAKAVGSSVTFITPTNPVPINTNLLTYLTGPNQDYVTPSKRTNIGRPTIYLVGSSGIQYIGTLYVPDLEKPHRTIEGNLKGKIILYNNGSYSLDFIKVTYEKGKEVEYDVFEFCGGLEYELDNFIDYIIQELE